MLKIVLPVDNAMNMVCCCSRLANNLAETALMVEGFVTTLL
jgi:hypothetical protein